MSIFLNTINISWIVPVISGVMFFIDSIVFALLEGAIRIIFIVGKINLSTISGPLEYLISNIKSLVGIYIIFKLSFLFIQYLVEPDAFKDKAKGGEAIIKNVIVVIILLTLLSSNLLFGIFNDIQKVIFSNGDTTYEVLGSIGIKNLENKKTDMIQNLIFGKEFSEKPAHMLTVEIAQMFIHNCPGAGIENKCERPIPWGEENPGLGVDLIRGGLSSSAIFSFIYKADNGASFFLLTQLDKLGNEFTSLQYISFISTAFGIYMIMKFFKYSLALVIRTFKLFVMQIISPIAIVSYITPDGKKTFSNFWKTYFTIYLELFLRMFIIYISIYIMTTFVSNKTNIIGDYDPITSLVLNILIFMGISKIMDELPDLISTLFGAKLGDPKQKSMAGILAGVIGGGIGAGIGIGSAKAAGVHGFGALFGGAMGMMGGAKSGANSQNLGSFISGQISNATKATGRGMDMYNAGGNLKDYMIMQYNKTLGGGNALLRQYEEKKAGVDYYSSLAADREGVKESGRVDYGKAMGRAAGKDWNSLDDVVNSEMNNKYKDAIAFFDKNPNGTYDIPIDGMTFTSGRALENYMELDRKKIKDKHENAADLKTTELYDHIVKADSGDKASKAFLEEASTQKAAGTIAKIRSGRLKAAEYNRKKTGKAVEFIDSGVVRKDGRIDFTGLKDKANNTSAEVTADFQEFTERRDVRNMIGRK